MTDRLSARDLRDGLADALNHVSYGEKRFVLHRRGRDVAALVSLDDLRLLEEMEDRIDAEEAEKAIREHRESGEDTVPYSDIRKEAGLE